MKTLITLQGIIAGAMIGLVALGFNNKAEAGVGVNADITFKNRYLGAPGFNLEEESVIQPSVTLSTNGFYGSLWTNFNERTGLSEVDYSLGYNRNIEGLNFDISDNLFDLKDQGKGNLNDDIHEAWLSVSMPGVVSPKLRFTQNFSGGTLSNSKGNHLDLILVYNGKTGKIPVIGKEIPFSLDGNIQYNNKYFIGNSGFSVAQAQLSLPFEINEVSVTPRLRFQKAIDKKYFKDITDFGVSVGYGF